MKRVAVLGSTGSIGTQTLEVLDGLGPDFVLAGIAANTQWELLAEQVQRYKPRRAVLSSLDLFPHLREKLAGNCVELAGGPDAVADLAASDEVDLVVNAIVGSCGLPPALAALRAGKTVALANKECLVMAGRLVNQAANEGRGRLVPVDSEHSAIFQALNAGRRSEVRSVWLTASGGPFLDLPLDELPRVTPEMALRHPTWAMGPKVTIDSATMMNKALEVIEAKWLFGLEPDQIHVVVHPQAIVHSLVEFRDGSMIAQLGPPDMRVPIQYALTWPERREGRVPSVDLAEIGRLEFREPEPERFPALALGYKAARAGGTMGAVLNAANEVAVQAFLEGRIAFTDIPRLVSDVMSRHEVVAEPDLEAIEAADRWARQEAEVWITRSS